MNRVCIKPLSINDAYRGRRFKTQKYNIYEEEVLIILPKISVPNGNLKLTMRQGLSNMRQDVDNAVKPFIDILQTKYEFNDCRIYDLSVSKHKVKKGEEYIDFEFEALI